MRGHFAATASRRPSAAILWRWAREFYFCGGIGELVPGPVLNRFTGMSTKSRLIKPAIRYNEAFKMEVVRELESEGLFYSDLQRYGIKGKVGPSCALNYSFPHNVHATPRGDARRLGPSTHHLKLEARFRGLDRSFSGVPVYRCQPKRNQPEAKLPAGCESFGF